MGFDPSSQTAASAQTDTRGQASVSAQTGRRELSFERLPSVGFDPTTQAAKRAMGTEQDNPEERPRAVRILTRVEQQNIPIAYPVYIPHGQEPQGPARPVDPFAGTDTTIPQQTPPPILDLDDVSMQQRIKAEPLKTEWTGVVPEWPFAPGAGTGFMDLTTDVTGEPLINAAEVARAPAEPMFIPSPLSTDVQRQMEVRDVIANSLQAEGMDEYAAMADAVSRVDEFLSIANDDDLQAFSQLTLTDAAVYVLQRLNQQMQTEQTQPRRRRLPARGTEAVLRRAEAERQRQEEGDPEDQGGPSGVDRLLEEAEAARAQAPAPAPAAETAPARVAPMTMEQLDGLSWQQLQKALAGMPFNKGQRKDRLDGYKEYYGL
jgi:hypothetical protein